MRLEDITNKAHRTVPVELIDGADNKAPHNTWFMRMIKRIWLPSRSKHRNQQKDQQISAIMTSLKYIEEKQEKLNDTTERLGRDVRDALETAERIYSYLPDIEQDG